MAIETNSFKVSRLDSEFLPCRREGMSTEDKELLSCALGDEADDDEVFDDSDSGAESDDFDLLELGEAGEEFCQVGDQMCNVPFEVYDLSGLGDILSMDVWNECLTEEERFSLAKYLPDMDQEMFLQTLKQLFNGSNLHFGSPMVKLFEMMKGGICEPRVALYRQGLMCFQKRQHCHSVRKYHNTMVVNLHQIRDAWLSCNGYSIKEKLQVLNIVKSQKSLMNEDLEGLGSEISEGNELERAFWRKNKSKKIPSQEEARSLKLAETKTSSDKETGRCFPSSDDGLFGRSGSNLGDSNRQKILSDYGLKSKVSFGGWIKDVYEEETRSETACQRGSNILQVSASDKAGSLRIEKNIEGIGNEYSPDYLVGYTGLSMKDSQSYWGSRTVDQLSDIQVLNAKQSKTRIFNDNGKKVIYPRKVQQFSVEEQMKYRPSHAFRGFDPFWQNKAHPEALSANMSPVYANRTFFTNQWQIRSSSSGYKYDANFFEESAGVSENLMHNGGNIRKYSKCEKLGYDLSDAIADDKGNNSFMINKLAYPHEAINGSFVKSGLEFNKDQICQTGNKGGSRPVNELPQFPMKISYLQNSAFEFAEDSLFSGSGRFGKKMCFQGANGSLLDVPSQILHPPSALETSGGDSFKQNDVPVSPPKWNASEVACFDERDVNVNNSEQLGNTSFLRERGNMNVDGELEMRYTDLSVAELGNTGVDQEPVAQIKPFIPITPTVHSGFSFSVIHLLSAVRMAMITMVPGDSLEIGGTNEDKLLENLDTDKSEPFSQSKVPSLAVKEIVNRVRSNPGDPSVLKTQEPLQDLVRGVLKTFSSKTAALGAKGGKSLALFEKSTKSWSWTGPVPQYLSDQEVSKEVTSPEAWLLPRKLLVMLVDAFANWLKSREETLRQIGSLPDPPLSLMQYNMDEKERFRDLRAQKSLSTISPSTEEIRDYFRKEESLRYSIPDRAFSYTAIDGKKSFVAPLKRHGSKLTTKARDHFMLKSDRPPQVTILCLVRDAAARLPGSIGTRADVCTLIRDSYYIVEDVSDAQINQVVSGAMDRLHYELDPCVQFDGERKLWVYLHRDKEEEDFEDDGTSSTNKWKRQKKDTPKPFENAVVTFAHHWGGEQSGIDLGSDLNANPSPGDEHKTVESFSCDGSNIMKENVEIGVGTELREQSGFNLGSDLKAFGDEHKAMESFPYDSNHMMKANIEIGVGSELQQSGFNLSSDFNVRPSYGDELKAMETLYYDGNHGMEDIVEIGGVIRHSSKMNWESLGLNSTREDKLLCQENLKNDDFGIEMFVGERSDEIRSSSLL